ncbi:hypothetical protein [Moraxella cuniculi]|uniref:hypothetical protein n=1 Tax=Moraxella cuniculi TaxID=34061 RepID=UPI000F840CD4|nr:hypothetical protein [Moraxella cuniculi]
MSHLELANWRQVLQACKGNAVCIENNNRFYAQKNLQNTQEFENACINNFNASNCQNLILRFQDGTQGDYNLKYIPNLYADISRLGGANANTTINSIRWNNATGGYFIRDTGIVNINRYHGNEAQAFIGELANDRLYGGGRAGSVAGMAGYGVVPKTSKNENLNQKTQTTTVSYVDKPKQKVNSLEVGSVVQTPSTHPENFKKEGKNYVNKYTGEIWQKSNSQHSDKLKSGKLV